MLVRMSFTITMSIFWAGWICCVMLGCYDQAAASSIESEIQLLQVGAFHGDEVSAESGEVWLGLYSTVRWIRANSFEDYGGDLFMTHSLIMLGRRPEKWCQWRRQTHPLVLIKGLNVPERGSIKALSAEGAILSPGKSLNLRSDSRKRKLFDTLMAKGI